MLRDTPLSPQEQREMYRMVEQTNRLLIGEQSPSGETLQIGIIQRIHKVEKWQDKWSIKMAFITGCVVTAWYGVGELIKVIHNKLTD